MHSIEKYYFALNFDPLAHAEDCGQHNQMVARVLQNALGCSKTFGIFGILHLT